MAQVISTICDFCLAEHDIHTTATTFKINDVEVDICEPHMREASLMDLVTRLESGNIAARSATAQAARGKWPCPHGCNNGKTFKSQQGLRQHMTRNHKE